MPYRHYYVQTGSLIRICYVDLTRRVFPSGAVVKNRLSMQEMRVQSLGGEDPLEQETATNSIIFAWKIP